jgi:hypothetical protein
VGNQFAKAEIHLATVRVAKPLAVP